MPWLLATKAGVKGVKGYKLANRILSKGSTCPIRDHFDSFSLQVFFFSLRVYCSVQKHYINQKSLAELFLWMTPKRFTALLARSYVAHSPPALSTVHQTGSPAVDIQTKHSFYLRSPSHSNLRLRALGSSQQDISFPTERDSLCVSEW